MNIKFDIECTPEEARAMMGLPDVKPMQEAMMAEVEAKMKAALASMEPEAMMKTWMPLGMPEGMSEGITGGMEGLEGFQKMFWSQMMGTNKPDSDK